MNMRVGFDRYFPNFSRVLRSLLDGLAVYRTPGQRPSSGRRRVNICQGAFKDKVSMRPNDVLVIQSKDWLSFEMTLPRISVREQKEVVALEVADRTPFRPGETVFDWNGTPGGTCTVNIVRNDLINEARQNYSGPHAFPRWLVCCDGGDNQFIDLEPKAKSAFQLPILVAAAITLSSVAIAGIFLTEAHRIRGETKALQDSVSLAETENREYKALRNYVNTHLNSMVTTRLSGESGKERLSVFRLLEELTKATPDHSFLLELDVVGTDVNILAISKQPENLLRSIESSPTFKDARVLGAISAEDDKFSVRVGFEFEAPAG